VLVLGALVLAGACRTSSPNAVLLQITAAAEAPRPAYLLLDWSTVSGPLFTGRRVPASGVLSAAGNVLATVRIEVATPRPDARRLTVRGMQGEAVVAIAEVDVPPSQMSVQRVTVILQSPAAADAGVGPEAGTPADAGAPPPDARPPVDAPPSDPQAPPPPDAGPETAPRDVGGGGTNSTCGPGTCKRVFVTSGGLPNGNAGGLARVDGLCQGVADGRGLGGTWKAWLSDGAESPSTRFTRATVPYRLVDGTVVANNFADLIDGTLAHAIDKDEVGARPRGINNQVWTGTSASGRATSASCAGWTSSATAAIGTFGLWDSSDSTWTELSREFCERADLHLYCFEQ
jgi:hypothetical protein